MQSLGASPASVRPPSDVIDRPGRSCAVVSAVLLTGCVHPRIVSSYADLRIVLKPEDRIVVTTSAGPVSGVVVEAMSADSVTTTSDHARREISRERITRVDMLLPMHCCSFLQRGC